MITCIIVTSILIFSHFSILVAFFVLVRIFVIGLEASLLLVLTLRSKARLCLTHFIEFCIVFVNIVFEYLILLILYMLVLQFLDNLFLLRTALTIFQVVHIKLVLQVVNVGVLLDVGTIETLQFRL